MRPRWSKVRNQNERTGVARLLPVCERPGRVSRVVRRWLALQQQKRRRLRSGAGTPSTELTDGLVEHFGFDETSGNRVGDVNGFVLAPMEGSVGACSGIIGNGARMDGTNYLLGTVETSAFCPTGSGLSVSVWVSLGSLVEPYLDAFIVSVWDDTNWPSGSSWQIYSSTPSDEVVGVQVLGSGYTFLSAATNLDDWTHLCLVNDGAAGEWRLYVNAELAMSVAFDSAMVPGRLAVGRHTNPTVSAAGGDVDELAIWNRPLEAAEVALLYNDGLGLAYPY